MDNLQTNKKYFIPMEVTSETIKAFNINAEDVQWSRVGNKKIKAIMVPATEEQYYEYMRPLWREDKQNQRASKQEDEGKMKPVSLDQLYEDTEFETADQATDIEADYMKKVLLEELHKALDELEEIDRTIMEMYKSGLHRNADWTGCGYESAWCRQAQTAYFAEAQHPIEGL